MENIHVIFHIVVLLCVEVVTSYTHRNSYYYVFISFILHPRNIMHHQCPIPHARLFTCWFLVWMKWQRKTLHAHHFHRKSGFFNGNQTMNVYEWHIGNKRNRQIEQTKKLPSFWWFDGPTNMMHDNDSIIVFLFVCLFQNGLFSWTAPFYTQREREW